MSKLLLKYDGTGVPEHTARALEDYLFRGYEPGRFLTSVLCNDLCGAVWSCDHINREALIDIVKFLGHGIPSAAWGGPSSVQRWLTDVDGCRTEYADRIEKAHVWEILQEKA